jgi:TonB family protein
MSALALAMYLTGAVALEDGQRHRSPPAARALPARPARPLASYFSGDDYPSGLERVQEGTVRFRLTIGPDGRVGGCAITGSSGSSGLDSATCRVLRGRARYMPARDAAGNPAPGVDHGFVVWRLPSAESDGRAGIPVPAMRAVLRGQVQALFTARDYPAEAQRARQAGQTIVRLVVGTTGRVIACDVAATSRSVALDAAACRILKERARYALARDARGAPACDLFWGPVLWVLPPLPHRLPRAVPASAPPPVERQLAPGACPGRTP